jgi:6-phosphogluconolactonase
MESISSTYDVGGNVNDTADAIVYIGTYTETLPHVEGKAEGIYVYRLQPDGQLDYITTTLDVRNPSFVTVAPSGRYAYAVEETDAHEGGSGAVRAFRRNRQTHELEPLNAQPTGGAFPCYVAVDQRERWVLVANHGGGSVAVFPIRDGGALGEATCVVRHEKAGDAIPHPHAIMMDPANRRVLVPDAGLDRVFVYELTAEGVLVPNDPPFVELPEKTGPRHLAWGADGAYAYVIGEGASTMTVLRYDAQSGALDLVQTISTLPPGFEGRSACADVHVHPSGWYVYGSNRGHDSIASFGVEAETGRLTPTGHVSTQGRTPRGFAIDPSGSFVLAANQNTDTVVTFAIDQTSGVLTQTEHFDSIPTPVCLCIVAV